MLVQDQPPLHLTYCLNIHAGETWPENYRAIQTHAVAVRQAVSPAARFGLGLRLSHQAASQLAQPAVLEECRHWLADAGLYAFTINGFPYGPFHGVPVKAQVYEPDWRTPQRRDYTCQLADVLARLLPENSEGSISTVPLGYQAAFPPGAKPLAMQRLMETVEHLHQLAENTGCLIHVGLEPEPDCVLQTTEETVRFFHQLWREGSQWLAGRVPSGQEEILIRRHLGVCFDTCHVALQFEDPAAMLRRYLQEGIRVSKIQISAALEVNPRHPEAVRPFDEPVYLHQVKALRGPGAPDAWPDLPAALAAWPSDARQIRIHFHVPLFWEGTADIRPTSATLSPEFWRAVTLGACPHLEVETYSFGMMPPAVRPPEVVRSLQLELDWVRDRLRPRSTPPSTSRAASGSSS